MKALAKRWTGRSAYRGLILGGIMLGMVASAWAASPPAFAAGTVIEPDYSAEHADDAPSLAPSGALAGFEIVKINGETPMSLDYNVMSPIRTTTIELQARQPAASTGMVVDPRFAGTVTLTVTPTKVDWTSLLILHTTDGPYNSDSVRDKDKFLSDLWFQSYTTGDWNIKADFSGMANGLLSQGTSLNTSDIDQCGTPYGERVRMSAGGTTEPFLNYVMQRQMDNHGQSVGPAKVEFDSDAGVYSVLPQCADVNMNEWFTTTRPIASLNVDLDHGTAGGWVYWGMRVPLVNVAPSVDVVKTTNDQAVTAVPGPTVIIGDPVKWGYTVENTGNTSLKDVTVTDDKVDASDIDCGDGSNTISLMAPGQKVTCTAEGTATAEGQYSNVATVTGTPVSENGEEFTSLSPVTDTATSWYFGKAKTATQEPTATPTPVPTTDPTTNTTVNPSATETSALATTGGDVASTFGPAALLIALGASVLLFARKRKMSETD